MKPVPTVTKRVGRAVTVVGIFVKKSFVWPVAACAMAMGEEVQTILNHIQAKMEVWLPFNYGYIIWSKCTLCSLLSNFTNLYKNISEYKPKTWLVNTFIRTHKNRKWRHTAGIFSKHVLWQRRKNSTLGLNKTRIYFVLKRALQIIPRHTIGPSLHFKWLCQ